MKSRERFETILSGSRPDRAPVSLWRHFPVDDQAPDTLVRAVLAFQFLYNFDLVKVTSPSSFMTHDWGAVDTWRGSTEGTREYTHRPIRAPEDWLRLPTLDPKAGFLGDQVEVMRTVKKAVGSHVPVLPTVFSPLDQARKLVGDDAILEHVRRYPDALHAGLRTITETTRLFIEACIGAGVDGVFFAIQHGQYALYTETEHRVFGQAYDFEALEPTGDLWLNMLHLHGTGVMFDEAVKYPVQIINWHDRETAPSLAEGKKRFPGMVCGGLRRIETMLLGDARQVSAEAADALAATQEERFLLGTGCVIPITTPHGNILAARLAVEKGAA